jgi:CHASE1-domain containing sensor protein
MPFLPAEPLVVLLAMAGLVLGTMAYVRILRRRHRDRRLEREADAEQLRGLIRVTLIGH